MVTSPHTPKLPRRLFGLDVLSLYLHEEHAK